MMLDKGQIKDWDGEPEADGKTPPAPKPEIARPETAKPDIANMVFGGREALPTGERVTLTPEEVTARRKRSQWIALALVAFVILIFVLTLAKVGGGIPERM